MLTKTDLKQIKNVVHDVMRETVPSMIKKEINDSVPQMIRDGVEPLIKKEIEPIKKDIKILKEDVSKIRKDIGTIANFFDNEYLELRKRVERIEHHLKLPSVV